MSKRPDGADLMGPTELFSGELSEAVLSFGGLPPSEPASSFSQVLERGERERRERERETRGHKPFDMPAAIH